MIGAFRLNSAAVRIDSFCMGRASQTVFVIGVFAIMLAAQGSLAAQERGSYSSADSAQRVSARELDSLLAPIALYPDQLLAPVLMAATYPHDVVEAADWASAAANASLRGDALAVALETRAWDPSVKTLAQFPDVLRMLNGEWDWMVRVGNAFLLQETEVMDSIQRLRHQAYAMGTLRSTNLQRVRFESGAVIIDMIDPATVYVPSYDPVRVYGYWSYPDYPPYFFHRPVTVTRYVVVPSMWGWSSWEWHRHRIRIDLPRYRYYNRHHPWPSRDDTWRHHPGRGRDVNIRRDGGRPDGWDRRGWDRDGWGDHRPDVNRRDVDGDRRGGHREGDRRDGDRPGWRGDGNGDGRRPDRGGGLLPGEPGQTEDRRRRFRGDRPDSPGRGDEGRRYSGGRPGPQTYTGPDLTPPGPLQPLVPDSPRPNREERRQELLDRREARGALREENRARFDRAPGSRAGAWGGAGAGDAGQISSQGASGGDPAAGSPEGGAPSEPREDRGGAYNIN